MTRRHVRKVVASEAPEDELPAAGAQPRGDAPPATRPQPSQFMNEPASEQDALLNLIAGMPAGARFGLERVRPEFAKGWLGTVELPEGAGMDYVLEAIREMWGGGTFRIKPLTRSGQWAPGAVTVNIAGAPLWRTMPYRRDGSIDDGTRPAPHEQQWYPAQPPAARAAQPVPAGDNPQIVTALSGLVSTLAGTQNAETRAKLEEVMATIRNAPQVAPAPPVDGFGEIRKSIELLRSLKDIAGDLFDRGGDDDEPAHAPAPDQLPPWMAQMMGQPGGAPMGGGMPFGGMPFAMPKKGEDLMMMLAMQWMMQRGQQQQPQAGQWVQGPQGQPVYVVPVQTPQGTQWMATQPPQAPPQQPPQQWTQPPPQQWAPPPQAAQAPPQWAPPAPPREAPPPVVDASARTAAPADDDRLTAREVLDELSRMQPQEAARFFDEVGSNLPPHVQGALMELVQRQAPQQPPPAAPQQRPSNVVGLSPFAVQYEPDK